MLAHIAFWDEAVVPVMMTMFRGLSLRSGWGFGSGERGLPAGSWPLADVHNAREAAWARGRSAAEVLEAPAGVGVLELFAGPVVPGAGWAGRGRVGCVVGWRWSSSGRCGCSRRAATRGHSW